MALHATLHVSGIPFATTAGSARLFDPAGYVALRSSTAVNASPLSHPTARRDLHRPDPRQVGLIRADDVVLARSADDQPWFVSPADPRHPFFHDHRVDHHPGMLLLEAARQHALLTLGRPGLRLSTATIRPLRFAEHTSPATLAAAPGADASHFPFHIRQLGRAVLEGALSFAAAP
jgi:hypothetical protein